MKDHKQEPINEQLIAIIRKLLLAVIILLFALVLTPIIFYNRQRIEKIFSGEPKPTPAPAIALETKKDAEPAYWKAPDVKSLPEGELKSKVLYGKELIVHTAKYLGPNGSVMKITNGMNCQNCHLDAGTKIFGNNYGSVASLYPKFRARSGSEEDIYKRVNDCMERSLNGRALDTNSNEMQAIKAYIEFVGSNVEKGKKAEGSGLKELAFLDRAADPENGKAVYATKCQSCHAANGEGILNTDGTEYTYPPLWGSKSYNDAAGLFRLSNFTKYVKYNMPLGASHQSPMLSDEEAWDVAAFVNSQPRPHMNVPKDWPDKSKKPIDHPFGPYADKFTEKQHKYGPFKPIQEVYTKK